MSAERDIAMAREALRLEREAVARYTAHPAGSSDPGLVAYWESLRRNEAGHRDLLEAWLRRRGADPNEDAAVGATGAAVILDGAAGSNAAAEVGQPGRGGPPAAGQGELVAASAAGAPVQFGQVQLQITAVGAERVQRADLGEASGEGAAGAGPLPEVEQ